MDLDAIIVNEQLTRTTTFSIGSLFQKICIVLANIQYSRNGFEMIRSLRTRLCDYYGIVHPQEVYHTRINSMSLVVFGEIREVCESFLTPSEKSEVYEYLNEIEQWILA